LLQAKSALASEEARQLQGPNHGGFTGQAYATSNQVDDPPLRVGVRFDVALGGRERGVSGQELHVPQRPADGPDLPGGVGDEAAPSAVARAAVEAEGPIPDGEQVDDRRGAGLPGSFGRDHEGRRPAPDLSLLDLDQRRLQFPVQRDRPARRALARLIDETDRVADLALGVNQHGLGQGRDFLGAQPGPRGEQEDRPVSLWVSRFGQIEQDRVRLAFAENLRLPLQAQSRLPNSLWISTIAAF